MNIQGRISLSAFALLAATAPAHAHLDPGEHGSFMAGFTHPVFGTDHVLVMIAVGLWAVTLGGRAMLLVPAVFVGTMALGFAAALLNMLLPFVEPVILASVVLVGLMVALAVQLPLGLVAACVAFFAFFHGHAHGGELGEAGALNFAAGFAVATALLHAVGIGIGMALRRWQQSLGTDVVTRLAGTATAVAGVWLAVGG